MTGEKVQIDAAVEAIQGITQDKRREWLKEVIEKIRGAFDEHDPNVVNEVLLESIKVEEPASTSSVDAGASADAVTRLIMAIIKFKS